MSIAPSASFSFCYNADMNLIERAIDMWTAQSKPDVLPPECAFKNITIEFPRLPDGTIALHSFTLSHAAATVFFMDLAGHVVKKCSVRSNQRSGTISIAEYDTRDSAEKPTIVQLSRPTPFKILVERNAVARVVPDFEFHEATVVFDIPMPVCVRTKEGDTVYMNVQIGDTVTGMSVKDFSHTSRPHASIQFPELLETPECVLSRSFPYLKITDKGNTLARCYFAAP